MRKIFIAITLLFVSTFSMTVYSKELSEEELTEKQTPINIKLNKTNVVPIYFELKASNGRKP